MAVFTFPPDPEGGIANDGSPAQGPELELPEVEPEPLAAPATAFTTSLILVPRLGFRLVVGRAGRGVGRVVGRAVTLLELDEERLEDERLKKLELELEDLELEGLELERLELEVLLWAAAQASRASRRARSQRARIPQRVKGGESKAAWRMELSS